MFSNTLISRVCSVLLVVTLLLAQAAPALARVPQDSFTTCATVTEITQAECEVLTALYDSTGGLNWFNNSGWLQIDTPCAWVGVSCSSGYVTGLALPNNNLSGSFPSLGNLANLSSLDLSGNQLSGNIPASLGSLTNLAVLNVSSNQLNGNISTEITGLSLISSLDLGYNLLTASEPTLLIYLATYDPDWAATQTVPPSNLQVVSTTSTSIEVSWTAIPYTSDGGYYEISAANNSTGPYTAYGVTADKTAAGYVFSGMSPGGFYYIRVRTLTPMHGTQPGDLWSEYTAPIFANALNPVPVLNRILPDHRYSGDGGFDLALSGANFTSDTQVLWNGIELATTFSSSSQLGAAVPALLLQSPGTTDVLVRNPAPGGGDSSIMPFTINPFTNSWIAHSPEGGVISDIAVDKNNPLVMYAVTDVAGVYKSVDGGQNWAAINNGINLAGPLGDIAVSPSNSSIIMASGAETYLSKNGGASWTDLLYNGNQSTNCIRFNPQDPNIITLGTSHGLLQTQDGGSTWQDIGKFKGHYIFAIEVDQQNPGTIYEIDIDPVIYNHTVWKTTDGGNSWVQLAGLPSFVGHLKVDPSNSSILYAATMRYGTAAEYGIYKSVDGGDTWTQVVANSLHYTNIVIDSSNPNHVYVAADNGVYRTGNGGLNWEFSEPQKFRDVMVLAIAESNPSVLYGAGFHGVFQSSNSGITWSTVNTGLYAHQIVDLAYSPGSNTLFAATKQGGVWRSTDYGASWGHIDYEMPFLNFLHMDPNDGNHLFVSSDGFQESKDGGQTWTLRSFAYSFGLLNFASNSDLFGVTSDGPLGPEHIYKSIDDGNNWVKKIDLPVCASLCRIYFLVADPLNPNILYAGASTMDVVTYHLYKTIDGGDSWVDSDNGAGAGSFHALAIDPINTSTLYLGTSWGIYKSINGGVIWTKVAGYGNTFVMAVDSSNTQTIYAGGIGIHRSEDGGATWTDFNYGLNPGVVWAILPIPASLPATANVQRVTDVTSQGNSVSRVFSGAGNLVYAYFLDNSQYTLSITSAHGTVIKNPDQPTYHNGDVVQLTAAPDAMWSFTDWTGDLISSANPASVTIHGNTIVTANYIQMPTFTPTPSKTATPTRTITPTVTATRTPVTKMFQSIAIQDGWILESAETSDAGGTFNNTAQTIYLGDEKTKKQYRGILSFNTSSLPDTAVITKVTLKVKQQAVIGGGNPVTMFQGFFADVKKGTFGLAALQITDFQAATGSVGKTYGPFLTVLSGGWYSLDLTAGKAYINNLTMSSGLTQIRLRFKLDDNNNAVANYLSLYSGNTVQATNRPQLVIQYYVP